MMNNASDVGDCDYDGVDDDEDFNPDSFGQG